MQQSTPGGEEKIMRLALKEARRGLGRTHPNPAVGAVLVKKGKILATGWHRGAGFPHAEIEALRAVDARSARGADLYITLEPCCTHGRTPPCTTAIVNAGIARVFYGAQDPNPRHAGRADDILREAGIKVHSGVLEKQCADLNLAWNKWISTGMPWVIAKAGMSLDGCIASHPTRRWITSPAARKDAMRLRAASGAILVGAETVRVDNPRLTLRGIRGDQPLRVVWTKSADLPPKSHLLTDAFRDRTLVLKNQSLRSVLKNLGRRGVAQVLIEGGGRVLGEAFDRRLVDQVVFYFAPTLLGGPVPAVGGKGAAGNPDALRLLDPDYSLVGGCVRLEARLGQ